MRWLRKLRPAPPPAAAVRSGEVFLGSAVIVRISGGLANQMLCYKLARYLTGLRQGSLVLDASPYGSSTADSDRNFQLLNYPLRYDMLVFSGETMKEIEATNTIARVTRDMLAGTSEADTARLIDFIREHRVVYCDLWVALRLREEADSAATANGALTDLTLDPVRSLDARGRECLAAIERAANAVAVHVRRGDFATHDGNLLLTAAYYNRAMRNIEDQLGEAVFVVFSDDVEWCRANLAARSRIVFADFHDERTAFKDMFLASQCRHFILSNESTFSHQMVQLSDAHVGRIVITSTRNDLVRNS